MAVLTKSIIPAVFFSFQRLMDSIRSDQPVSHRSQGYEDQLQQIKGMKSITLTEQLRGAVPLGAEEKYPYLPLKRRREIFDKTLLQFITKHCR